VTKEEKINYPGRGVRWCQAGADREMTGPNTERTERRVCVAWKTNPISNEKFRKAKECLPGWACNVQRDGEARGIRGSVRNNDRG